MMQFLKIFELLFLIQCAFGNSSSPSPSPSPSSSSSSTTQAPILNGQPPVLMLTTWISVSSFISSFFSESSSEFPSPSFFESSFESPSASPSSSASPSKSSQVSDSSSEWSQKFSESPIILNGTLREIINSTNEIILDSIKLVLPKDLSGSFITASTIKLSGTLIIDLSNLPPGFYGTIQLFSGTLEGSFSSIHIEGYDGCTIPDYQMAGKIYVINTCATISSGTVNLVF